jgi:hypothetical protein
MRDKLIVNCAERLIKKLKSGYCIMLNDSFLPPVESEVERMKHLCNKRLIEKLNFVEKKLRIAEDLVDFELQTELECRYEEIKL